MNEINNQIDTSDIVEKLDKKYSFYDYLKANSGVAIALVSAVVAIITFFAKTMTWISTKRVLMFWEFNSSYATFGNESIVYTFIFAIVISCFMSISSMLSTSTYNAYLSYNKFIILANAILEREQCLFDSIESQDISNEEKAQEHERLVHLNQTKKLVKESKRLVIRNLIINLIFVLFVIFLNSFLLVMMTTRVENGIFLRTFKQVLIQVAILILLNIFLNKSTIDKEEIRKNCYDEKYVVKVFNEQKNNEYPLTIIFSRGLRSILTNNNIVLIVLMIVANCGIWFCVLTLPKYNPIDNLKVFQTTFIDNQTYAIVHREGEKYFLEEAEIKMEKIEDNEFKETLVIYTNKQRIAICNDISIEINEYDNIIKEHK